jgi:hypothetical protein
LPNSSDQKSVGTVPAHDACLLECHDATEQDVQESGKQKFFLAVNPVLAVGKNAGSAFGERRIRMLMRIRIQDFAGRKFEKMYN